MSGLEGYFVAPDGSGEMWIWKGARLPRPVISAYDFRDDPELWDYFVSDLPFHFEGAS